MELASFVTVTAGLPAGQPGEHYPSLRAESLDREVAWALEFGFTGLQLGWKGAPPLEPAEMAQVVAEQGVKMVALSAYTDFFSTQHNWPCRDKSEVLDRIAAARSMGIDTIVTWGGFGDSSDPQARQRVRADLAEVVRCAENHRVKVALELYDRCVFGTVEDICQLADQLGTPMLGVMMDPPNTMKEGDLTDLAGYYGRIIQGAGRRMFAVHAKDVLFEGGQRKLPGPGQGSQDYVAFIRALAAAGFDGHLVIEHVNRQTVGPARDYVARKLKEALGR